MATDAEVGVRNAASERSTDRAAARAPAVPPAAVRILGLDPGLRRTGWGIIESLGSRLSFIADGVITPDEMQAMHHRHHGGQVPDGNAAPDQAPTP